MERYLIEWGDNGAAVHSTDVKQGEEIEKKLEDKEKIKENEESHSRRRHG